QTGWIKDYGKDYLLYSNGVMVHDTVLYGYRFESNGVATKI
ncbi:MAG: surface protein PspC, partial [Clostridium butyricum]